MIAITFTGNVTQEPKTASTSNGMPVCNFSVAVEPTRRSSRANVETKYIHVSAWGKLAEVCGKYVRKGAKVGVTSKDFDLGAWIGKDGKAKADMKVNADDVEFLSSKAQEEAGKQAQTEYEKANPPVDTSQQDFMNGFVEVSADDLPF